MCGSVGGVIADMHEVLVARKPGMLPHTYDPGTQEERQQGHKFRLFWLHDGLNNSLGYMSTCLNPTPKHIHTK